MLSLHGKQICAKFGISGGNKFAYCRMSVFDVLTERCEEEDTTQHSIFQTHQTTEYLFSTQHLERLIALRVFFGKCYSSIFTWL